LTWSAVTREGARSNAAAASKGSRSSVEDRDDFEVRRLRKEVKGTALTSR